jgi:ATP-dependent RNA helicase DOB1
VDDLSSIRVYIAKDLRPLEARERAARSVDEVLRRFPNGVPTLDPEEDMQVPARRATACSAFLSKVQDVLPRV